MIQNHVHAICDRGRIFVGVFLTVSSSMLRTRLSHSIPSASSNGVVCPEQDSPFPEIVIPCPGAVCPAIVT